MHSPFSRLFSRYWEGGKARYFFLAGSFPHALSALASVKIR